MKRIIALSAIGFDRPGIVAGLAEVFYELGCNLEESSMTRLRRDFAVILLVSIPDDMTLNRLHEKLQPVVSDFKLTLNIRELNADEMSLSTSVTEPNHILSIYGIDKPGIVYLVSELLAKNNINITDLETQVSEHEQKHLYALILEITIPEDVSIKRLTADLKNLGERLSVDVSIEPLYSCEDM